MVEPLPIILDVKSVVELEQAIAAAGTSLNTLMEHAGRALAAEALAILSADEDDDSLESEAQGAQSGVVILAGSGNNGGDGWAAAGELAEAGCIVRLVTPKAADEIKAEPARSWATAIEGRSLPTLSILENPDDEALRAALGSARIVIDALLGTGFSGATVRPPMDRWITLLYEERSRRAGRPARSEDCHRSLTVIAADVPSGWSAQSGDHAEPSVYADVTVTMLGAKPGLFSTSARSAVGKLIVDDLGVNVTEFLPAVIFRHAVPEDLDDLITFYDLMIATTTGTDNDPLWLAGTHPSKEELAASINAQELLIGESLDERMIVAAAVLDQDWNCGYDQGAWTIPATTSQVWTLHLVAVHPEWQHQGLSRRLIAYAAYWARQQGGTVFRIDVLASNFASLVAYERLGFHRVGPVKLHYEDPRVTDFVLFEKALADA